MNELRGSNADGQTDYSRFSEEQLVRSLRRINAEKCPLDFANLKAAFTARQIPIDDAASAAEALMAAERAIFLRPPPTSIAEFRIAFAPRAGFLTWLGPSRNDFRFVGPGTFSVLDRCVEVKGRRFGFLLGLPLRQRIQVNKADIFNVELEQNVVRFECRAEGGKSRALTIWLVDRAAAENLIQLLPAEKKPEFVPQLAAYLDFEARLERQAPHLPVTYGFAMSCLVMFGVTVSHGAEWLETSGLVHIAWGSNYGAMTTSGQWWRLLTHSLLHFGAVHLAFNLWALVSFGAVAERLYGSLRYSVICLLAGTAGGMVSIVMQPDINSAGASAVIFGILGALLVAQLRGSEAIPASVQRSLRNSTMFFALVTLAAGFLLPGIDNAAHVGGPSRALAWDWHFIHLGACSESPRRWS